MFSNLRHVICVVGLLVMPCLQFFPLSAQAQEGEVDSIVRQAEEDAGNRRYEAAVKGYLRAYESTDSPIHLYNISVLYFARLDSPLKAWDFAMRFKEAAGDQVERDDAGKLIGLIEDELEKKHGKVVIHVKPGDAGLWLDRRIPEAVLTRKTAWVTPGPHTVIGSVSGFSTGKSRFDVEIGENAEVELVLKAKDAVIKVSSNVPKTWFWVETEKIGLTPVEKRLKPGRYHIRAEAEGFRPLEQVITLKAGETRSLKAKLTALPEEPVEAPPPSVEAPVVMDKPPGPAPDRTWAWVSFGGTGAALVAGTVLYFVGRDEVQSAGGLKVGDFNNFTAYDREFDSRVSKGKSEIYAGYACWGLSGAALIAAITLYFTADVKEDAAIAPMGPNGPGMTAMIRW